MTYQPNDNVYISDVDASDLGYRAGEFPPVLLWNDRLWERESPKFDPEGALAAFLYTAANEPDYPELLMLWND